MASAAESRSPRSWLEIIDALYDGSWNPTLQRFRSPYAFRGVSHADDDLSSSLLRLAAGRRNVGKLELSLLRNFRKYAHTEAKYVHGEAPGGGSIWHWLALAQHRGLPTRLVDWTYSPFVALHFATENPQDFDHDGMVWCVNFVAANKLLPRQMNRILQRERSDTVTVEMLMQFRTLATFDSLSRKPFVVFLEPPTLDTRILNQFALCSLMSSATASLKEWLDEHPELFRKMRVPSELKWEIRDKLDQANVNERVLFPGLDGLSRWLARYYMPKPAASLRSRRSERQTAAGLRVRK